ncbi:ferritin-like domain-containing protein [Parapusillimonas sp. JC17]|uniref:ferritin-like domain-containing protein n=1 Tax=Parapusillimonas sp. JC17 TaxID=3445768 RepID=UPI003F9FFD88
MTTTSNQATDTLSLDEEAISKARSCLSEGAVTPSIQPYAEQICKLLNDALATEWVCVLRYRRHYFTAQGLESPAIAEEFLVHATQEQEHADKLSERIVQLGGEPKLDPASFSARSHADYDESTDLKDMIRANLVAERVIVEVYRQMIGIIGDKDPTTTQMLKSILADEEEHADELSDWLEK